MTTVIRAEVDDERARGPTAEVPVVAPAFYVRVCGERPAPDFRHVYVANWVT